MRRAGYVALSVVVSSGWWNGGEASAAEGVPVAFTFEGCDPALATQVERIARIELHATHDGSDVVTRLGLACSDDAARLTVDDPVTSKRVERTVALAAVAPEGRARLLALAIAELARSSWLELAITPIPVLPSPTAEGVSEGQRQRALDVALQGKNPALWGFAAIDGLYIPSVGPPIVGLSLGVHRELPKSLFIEGALSGWDGAASRSTGGITIRQVGLDPAIGVRAAIFDLSAGVRVGWTVLAGSPSVSGLQGNSASGAFFGPLLAASVRVIGPLQIGARTGWLVHGERGVVSGDSDVTVGGYWVSLAVGLRLGS